MRWRGRRESENVEDRRGESSDGGFGFPMPRGRGARGFPMPRGRGGRRAAGGGIGLIVVVVVMLLLGVDPSILFQGNPGGSPFPQGQQQRPQFNPPARRSQSNNKANNELAKFVSVVLADTEETWTKIFRDSNKQYQKPKLVLFTDLVQSGCGRAQSASGPFYCPSDQKVYVDLGFYRELRDKFKAPGDFAQAYVIAHEVGHHVQTVLGIAAKVVAYRRRASQADGNAMQVRMELQADCLAGIWANRARKKSDFIEKGDIEEGLNAASAIGDDRIQKRTRGYVVPDSFTHGSSAQRVRWFKRGLETGEFSECDTFNAARL